MTALFGMAMVIIGSTIEIEGQGTTLGGGRTDRRAAVFLIARRAHDVLVIPRYLIPGLLPAGHQSIRK